MAKNITKNDSVKSEQDNTQKTFELMAKAITQLTEKVSQLESRRTARAVSQPTGRKTGTQVDMAIISHMIPTRRGTGYNIFLKSSRFKKEDGKSKSYRVYVPSRHIGKIRVGKQIAVFNYHSNGKNEPATSVKLTLASGISRWTAIPNKEVKQ